VNPYGQNLAIANEPICPIAYATYWVRKGAWASVGSVTEEDLEEHDAEDGEDDDERVSTNPCSSRNVADGSVNASS
jgi:hypothetical protein